jgi:hypothetical protein
MEAGNREIRAFHLSRHEFAGCHGRSRLSRQLAARALLEQGDQVIVFTGGKATAILPDREQELGEIGPGDSIVSLKGPRGYAVEVRRGARA